MLSAGKYDAVESLTLEADGHYHLNVPTFYNFDNYANTPVDFVFDTGAFLTVITRDAAARLGFHNRFTVQENITLSGFSGECLADLKEIPGFTIGGRKLTGVKVAVPHIETNTSILGLNVIEYFKYFIDTEHDKIYFAENPMPEIPAQLQSSSILYLS
ncbi:MAG: retroviral-like aspartic protease family protein [Defluviitaleaceae bacterium]|nr:retroviral-like aspartic protease family protein [Defluviitaleaceae bacterium]